MTKQFARELLLFHHIYMYAWCTTHTCAYIYLYILLYWQRVVRLRRGFSHTNGKTVRGAVGLICDVCDCDVSACVILKCVAHVYQTNTDDSSWTHIKNTYWTDSGLVFFLNIFSLLCVRFHINFFRKCGKHSSHAYRYIYIYTGLGMSYTVYLFILYTIREHRDWNDIQRKCAVAGGAIHKIHSYMYIYL